MNKSFEQLRRQQFLSREFYAAQLGHHESDAAELLGLYQAHPENLEHRRSWSFYLAEGSYQRLSLLFTAGEPIEKLRAELTGVVEAYERFQVALASYEQIPKVAPLGLRDIGDYERCMQLIGLCYLLHRRDLLPRIAALQDPGYAGEDALYEDLLDYALPERYDTDAMLHLEVYDPLIDAMYADSDEACVQSIQRYVDEWYPHFKYVPWHDGHLGISGTEGYYFGYWAFEAGAVALLCNIDDSQIDHMVYPKDLVAWALAHAHLSEPAGDAASSTASLRCEAGQPCPQSGYWFTPARANSRRHFESSELMPEMGGDYGVTIWQREPNQSVASEQLEVDAEVFALGTVRDLTDRTQRMIKPNRTWVVLDTSPARNLAYEAKLPDWVATFQSMTQAGYRFCLSDVAWAELLTQRAEGRTSDAEHAQIIDGLEKFLDFEFPILFGNCDLLGILGLESDWDSHLTSLVAIERWSTLKEAQFGVPNSAKDLEDDRDHYKGSFERLSRSWEQSKQAETLDPSEEPLTVPLDAYVHPQLDIAMASVRAAWAIFPTMDIRKDLEIRWRWRQFVRSQAAHRPYDPTSKKKRNDGVDLNLFLYLMLPAFVVAEDEGFFSKISDISSFQKAWFWKPADLAAAFERGEWPRPKWSDSVSI